MAKVFGIHMIVLHPGVKAEDFEKFLRKKLPARFVIPGWNVYIAKGDRGEQAGHYILLYEIASIEARDLYSPQPGERAAEAMQLVQDHADILAFDAEYQKYVYEVNYTDYVVIAASAGPAIT